MNGGKIQNHWWARERNDEGKEKNSRTGQGSVEDGWWVMEDEKRVRAWRNVTDTKKRSNEEKRNVMCCRFEPVFIIIDIVSVLLSLTVVLSFILILIIRVVSRLLPCTINSLTTPSSYLCLFASKGELSFPWNLLLSYSFILSLVIIFIN